MADITFDIPGVGVLKGPEWATEETLKQVKAILEGKLVENSDDLVKLIEILVKGGKVDERVARETMEAAKDSGKATAEATQSASKAKVSNAGWMRRTWKQGEALADTIKDQDIGKHLQEAGGMLAMPIKSMEDAFAKISGLMTAVGASVFNASKKLIASMGKIGAALGSMLGGIGMVSAGLLSLATGAAGYLLGAITAMGDSFFDLYDTGINFAGSLQEGATGLGSMLSAATDARLSLGDFSEFLAKNTSVALAIGAKNMADLSKRVRNTIFSMGMFGLSIGEVNEFLGDYLEQQRMAGVLGAMDQAQRAKAGAEYIEQITRLSMITGKRRKQIAEELSTQSKSIHVVSYLNSLTADQAALQKGAIDTITGVMRSLDESGDMAKDFTETMFYGSFQASDSFATMVQTGYEVEAQMLSDIQQRVKSGEIDKKTAEKEMAQVVKAMAQNEKAAEITANQIAAGNLAAGQFAGVTNKAQMLARSMDSAAVGMSKSEKALGAWDEMQNAVSMTWTRFIEGLFGGKGGNAFSKSMNDAMGTLQEMLKPDGPLIKSLHEMADVMANHVIAAFEWFKGDGPGKLKKFLKDLPNNIKAFSDAIKGFLFEKIGEEDVLDKDGNKTGAKKAIYGEMKSFGDMIFGAIGKGLEDVNWLKVVGVITAGFVAILAAKSFIGVFTSKVSGAMSGAMGKVFDKIPGMGAASKAGAAASKAVSGGKGAGKGPMDVIAGAVGKLGKGVGQAIKGLMQGIAGGLSAFKPQVLIGAGIFGLSIAAVGAGIAAASWIMGRALPTLAEGLGSFDDLDGDNLIDVGLGMGAVAVGLAAMGGGTVVAGIGGLVGGAFSKLGEMIGAKSPLVMLEEFSKVNINTKNAIKNAEAMGIFFTAMAAGGAGATVSGLGTLVGGITGALGKFFGADDPLTQLKKFGAVDIDGAKVKTNAEAMKLFASAMTDVPLIKADVIGALFSGVVSIFGGEVKMPWDNLKLFAAADIDGVKVKTNADAMNLFAGAMTNVPLIKADVIGALFSGVVSIFGGAVKMPWDNLKLFADADLGDSVKLAANAEAMNLFAGVMTNVPEIETTRVGGLFGAIGTIFGGTTVMPWAQVKLFADADLGDSTKIAANANAMNLFAGAMTNVPEIKTTRVGGLFGAIADIFGGEVKMPWAQVKLFADADLGDSVKLAANANAMNLFAGAMTNVPEIKTTRVGGLFGAIGTIFGGTTVMPWPQVKLFANADMGDSVKLASNAKALGEFGAAIAGMPEMPEGKREGGAWGFVKSIFAGDTKMPWDKVKAFADADMGDTTKIVANANALSTFSKTMSGMDLASLEAWGDSDSMDKISSAFGNLFGKKSPLTQIANLDKISTPLMSAGIALDGFNPKMKTLYDMLKDPAFVTGVGAIKVMTANLGQLDDVVNDWSKNELAQFKSITTSLGNFQGAQIKTAGTETATTLKEIHKQLGIINENITAQTAILTQETKKTTTAVAAAGVHM